MSTETTSPTNSLSLAAQAVRILATHYAQRAESDDVTGRELARVLQALVLPNSPQGELAASGHLIRDHLAQPTSSHEGTVSDVLDAFRVLFPILPWRYGYDPRPDLPSLEQRMAWAELVGPLAPFFSERICIGITAIGPHTRYPEHLHPAVEVYYVLSGTALWTAGGITHERPPGSFILHPANTVHVMETGDEPLIAAYTWSGDIISPSVYTEGPKR
jgi:quercetin dioxygenase-like cupin family protein